MPSTDQRSLKLAACALVFASYAALMTSYRYGAEIMLVPIAAFLLMPIGEWLDRRGPSFRQLTSVLTFLYIVALPFLWSTINLLDAVTALVVYIQIYTLIHEKNERNYNHIVLMSFFLLLAASVMTPSPAIGLVLVAFVFAAVWTLIALEAFSASAHAGSPEAPDIVSIATRDIPVNPSGRRLLDGRIAVAIAMCSVAILGMTAALFFFSPRMEAGILGAQDPESFQTGLSDEVDLSAGGTISRDTSAVMRVKFPELRNGRYDGEMYWRSTTFDYYSGSGWTRRGLTTVREQTYIPVEYQRFSSRYGHNVQGGAYRQEISRRGLVMQEVFLDQATEGALPALTLVQSLEAAEGQRGLQIRWDRANDFTVVMSRRNGGGVYYRAWSEIYEPSPRDLIDSSADYGLAMDDRDFEVLTTENLLPQSRELARQIAANENSVYEKVAALQRYFGGQEFQYTLDVPDHAEQNPVDDFILNTKAGHCQLFGSALALMARSLDIPARVVNGYRGGRYDASDDSYTVTADMAHLWVEVFFPDHGWVTFDPSPPSPEFDPLTIGALRREMSRIVLKGKLIWYQNIEGFTPETRMANLRNVTIGLFRPNPTPSEKAEAPAADDIRIFGHLTAFLPVAAIVAGVLLAVFAGSRLARHREQTTRRLSDDQLRAVRLHGLLEGKLRQAGIDPRGKSVDELRAAIQNELWTSGESAIRVLSSYNAVRFGARPLSPEVYGLLRRAVRGLQPPA